GEIRAFAAIPTALDLVLVFHVTAAPAMHAGPVRDGRTSHLVRLVPVVDRGGDGDRDHDGRRDQDEVTPPHRYSRSSSACRLAAASRRGRRRGEAAGRDGPGVPSILGRFLNTRIDRTYSPRPASSAVASSASRRRS